MAAESVRDSNDILVVNKTRKNKINSIAHTRKFNILYAQYTCKKYKKKLFTNMSYCKIMPLNKQDAECVHGKKNLLDE